MPTGLPRVCVPLWRHRSDMTLRCGDQMGVELGWAGIAIPERFGGAGLGPIELGILQHEQGRRLLPSPFFSTVCLATPIVTALGTEAQQEDLLGRIASGKARMAVALSGLRGTPGCIGVTAELRRCGSRYRLQGESGFVIHGHAYDMLLVAARAPGTLGTQGVSVVAIERDRPGVKVEKLSMLDLTRPMARLEFDLDVGVESVLGEVEGAGPGLEQALRLARISLACEAVGGAEWTLEMTTAYVRQRVQFGRPIGSFQAVKHRLADIMVLLEAAKSASWYAACVAGERPEELAEAAAMRQGGLRGCLSTIARPTPFNCMEESASPGSMRRSPATSRRARATSTSARQPCLATRATGPAHGSWRGRRAGVLKPMKLGFTVAEELFRARAAAWLREKLAGEFSDVRGIRSYGVMPERRKEWEQELGRARWGCIGWPQVYGGRDATLAEQVIFAEEYARAGAPIRLGHLGVELLGPTLLALGTDTLKTRFLPPMARGEEIWCQGYSEPNAGSDLASVRTRCASGERPSRGRVEHRRPEDLDLTGTVRRLDLSAGAY